MAQSEQKRREFTGPALYSHGFRPFFLFAGIWAALAMLLWVMFLSTGQSMPSRMAGVDWHMHEMVFGYTSAVIAGFLLTAVPNWTGRLPIIGWPTALLSGLWVLGRVAIFFSNYLPEYLAPIIDVSFLLVFAAVIGREIFAGKNWRNLKVLIIVLALAVANIWFHLEAMTGSAYQGTGIRLGVGMIVMLISIIGGRVIPSFTRNWLVRLGKSELPAPYDRFDQGVLVITGVALMLWVFVPGTLIYAVLLGVGLAHVLRLWRWNGWRTWREPLVLILHVGYLFVPLGFMFVGLSVFDNDGFAADKIPHAWMVGAIGIMTLAMMSRASLGHSGRPLKSDWKISFMYGLVILASLVRMGAELYPGSASLLHISATAWILGYAGFTLIYFPVFTQTKLAKQTS